jgi:DNA-binding transcriptional LysR family regulator
MLEKANEIKGLDVGIIRIGTLASISCHWMPELLKEFQVIYPKVQFVLHQGDYDSIQEWIRIGAIDFGFVSPDAVNGIETIMIKEGLMLAVIPENHPLAVKGTIALNDLVEDPYIMLEEGHYNEPMEKFQEQGLKPNIKYLIHDDYAIMAMVEAGLGISILAELVLHRTEYNVALRPTDPPIIRKIAIGYKDKSSLPMASKIFINYLLTQVEILP